MPALAARSPRTPSACALRGVEARHASHGAPGFSLVEALVGLSLLALVLGFSLVVLYRVPRHLEVLRARQEANRAAEAVLEEVRAGARPLIPGYGPVLLADRPAEAAENLRAWLDVRATGTPDLYEVAVFLRYKVLQQPRTVTVETMAWRP